jgi:hypothetical protein
MATRFGRGLLWRGRVRRGRMVRRDRGLGGETGRGGSGGDGRGCGAWCDSWIKNVQWA